MNAILYDCASTYLAQVPQNVTVNTCSRKERKVEDTKPIHTGKRFNHNSGDKSNFASYIDISN